MALKTILIHESKKHLWDILNKYEEYDTYEKLAKILNRPIDETIWNMWHGTEDTNFVQRQLLLHQGQQPQCCR